MKKIRIDKNGQTQVNCGDGWEDISSEEYDELINAGYEVVTDDLLLESENR